MKKSTKTTIIIVACILACVFIFYLPKIISHTAAKNLFEKKIAKATDGNVHIKSVHLTWFGPQKIRSMKLSSPTIELSVESFALDASIFTLLNLKKITEKTLFTLKSEFIVENADVSFHFPNQPPIIFANVYMSLQHHSPIKTSLSISGDTYEKTNKGQFFANISIDQNKAFIGNIDLQKIPVYGLDLLFTHLTTYTPGMLPALFGKELNAIADFSLKNDKGPVTISITSSNARCYLNGYFNDNFLTLQDTFTASITLNDEFNKFILQESKSRNVSTLYSLNPIHLRVDPKDFYLPLKPFKLKDLTLYANLNLGRLIVKNEKTLSQASKSMQWLSLHPNRETSIWCTSVNLYINNGILDTSRMDMLLNNDIHICTWGKVNLLNHKLNLTLGITADALQDALGVNLPEKYVLQIPIRGTLTDIKIDTKTTAAKVAALIASQQLKGPAGFIGGMIGKATETPAPPPNRPFPWEKSYHKSTNKQSQEAIKKFLEIFE